MSSISGGLRQPETWTYKSRPGRTFGGSDARIRFDRECRSVAAIDAQLDQIAASKVTRPNLGYPLGPDGRLVKLEDQLPKKSPARALVETPRQDFPLTADVSYLMVSDGMTGIAGLVRGESSGLSTYERDGRTLTDVVVVASVAKETGEEVGWMEKRVAAEVQPDGTFLASYGLAEPPGSYALKVGAVLEKGAAEKGGAGSLVSLPIEAPDFSGTTTADDGTTVKEPAIASILFIRAARDVKPGAKDDPADAYASFQMGQTELVPYFGHELHQTDTPSFYYLVSNLTVDATTGKADAVAQVTLLRDGKTVVAKAPENPITTAFVATGIGPVPLKGFEPGSYVVQVRVTDRQSKETKIRNEKFTVVP